MKLEFTPYLIQCITNLHAGSGDTNQGMIDKMVQREHITHYPTIHSTSMKGALREHFSNKWKDNDRVNEVFGSDNEDQKDTGTHKFLSADLLAIPIRATYHQYVYGIEKDLVDQTNQKSQVLINNNIFKINPKEDHDYGYGLKHQDCYAEDFLLTPHDTTDIFNFGTNVLDRNLATFTSDHYSILVKSLPVVARNRIGENKNLWYEEYVPAKTLFMTYIGGPENDFNLDGELVQIGANASVGFGLCQFTKIKLKGDE